MNVLIKFIKKNKEAIRIVLTLVVFVFVAAFAIAFTNEKTYETIKQREKEAEQKSLLAVLSEGSDKTPDSIAGFGRFYRETINGKTIGFAFMSEARGYDGKIRFFSGIDTAGRIKGLSIVSQTETPGLGTRVEETISDAKFPFGLLQKRKDTEPWFVQQFRGLSAINNISLNKKSGEWHKLTPEAKNRLLQNNQISVISGSTITTAAISNELTARARLLISLLNENRGSEKAAPRQNAVIVIENDSEDEDDDESEDSDV